jgi:transcriptional regulator with XRE-family HTH domain
MKSQFPERLRFLQEQRGLNNAQLAKEVGLSHVAIGNFLDGQLPKAEYLIALADFFGVSTDCLLGRDNKSIGDVVKTSPMNEALAEMEGVKEKVQSLDHVLQKLKSKTKR